MARANESLGFFLFIFCFQYCNISYTAEMRNVPRLTRYIPNTEYKVRRTTTTRTHAGKQQGTRKQRPPHRRRRRRRPSTSLPSPKSASSAEDSRKIRPPHGDGVYAVERARPVPSRTNSTTS